MRIVEKCWVNLSAGYKTARSMEAVMLSDWKRAIQVAESREIQAVKSKRKQRQRIIGIAFLGFLFLCMFLWVVQLYVPENRVQIWFYLCTLAVPAAITGIVLLFYASQSYKKTTPNAHPSLKLTDRWWESLAPGQYMEREHGDKGEISFLRSLSFLDDNHIAVWKLLTSAKVTSDTDVLVLGPSGIWVFEVKFWNGRISRRSGVWTKENRGETIQYPKSPDQQWLDQKEEIAKTIKIRIASKPWIADFIHGGIVFAHSNAVFGLIEGNTASYGKPGGWHKRLRNAKPIAGFGNEERLQVLDALIAYANLHEKEPVKILSAVHRAQQLYDEASVTLREYVLERVK